MWYDSQPGAAPQRQSERLTIMDGCERRRESREGPISGCVAELSIRALREREEVRQRW